MKLIKAITSGKKAFILILAIIGILLIGVSYIFSEKNTDDTLTDQAGDELAVYGKMLEDKLCRTLSSLTGENTIEVMITFSGTFETVYAGNIKTDGISNSTYSSEKTLASFTSTGSQNPIIVKRNCPKINGVMIVCLKSLEAEEYSAIKKAACTALNISESKIYIIGGETSYG
ncbi:MAG: hypothetical protein J6K12_06690 [Clostridia bacterium]|nr:hypothetical protein [Clostridia bacterium]